MSDHLSSPEACVRGECAAECQHVVQYNRGNGRWFITMGHAGFNLPANNGQGYLTRRRAVAAHRRCASRRMVGAR